MPDDRPITAKPKKSEWVTVALVYPLAALVATAAVSMGIDQLNPDFLTEDHAQNRLRMGVIFAVTVLSLLAMTVWTNRKRHYQLFEDRLVIGGTQTIGFAGIAQIRVGAPMPRFAEKIAGANAKIGRISASNAGAAAMLTRQYERTVVIDEEDTSTVINLATVARGDELLHALIADNRDKIVPSEFSAEERKLFGKFKPGTYARVRGSS